MVYLLFFVLILNVLLLVSYWIGNYFLSYALMPNMGAQERVVENGEADEAPSIPDEETGRIQEQFEKEKEARDTWKQAVGLNEQAVQIQTKDGLTLRGHALLNPTPTHKWVIALHGYQSNEDESLLISRHFYEAGYNILTYGLRAHGQSDGQYIGMGYLDKEDLITWTEALVQKYPKSEIYFHGTSMGGATVLFASGLDLPENVKAIVSDCAYTSIWSIFSQEMKHRFNMGAFPVLYLAQAVGAIKAGYNIRKGHVAEYVAKSERPILFIHSKPDDFVPVSMVYELCEAKSQGEKELYLTEQGAHAEAKFAEPVTYYQRVLDFFDKYTSKETVS